MSEMKRIWIFESTSLGEAYEKAASVGGTWLDVSATAQGAVAIVEAQAKDLAGSENLFEVHEAVVKALFSLAEPIPSSHDGIQILEATSLQSLVPYLNRAVESQFHLVEIRIKRAGSAGAVAFISGPQMALKAAAENLQVQVKAASNSLRASTLELQGEVRRHF
jgi:hypothetical protein